MTLIIKIYIEDSSSGTWKESDLKLNKTPKGDITAENKESSLWIDKNGHLLVQGEDGALYRVNYDLPENPLFSKAAIKYRDLTWYHSNEKHLINLTDYDSYPAVVKRWQQWRSTSGLIHKINNWLEPVQSL